MLEYGDFTKGNSDNLNVAGMALNIFTKSWCMDCAETKKHNDLIFRCSECEFQKSNGDCMIKQFAINHIGDLPNDFGSMGSP